MKTKKQTKKQTKLSDLRRVFAGIIDPAIDEYFEDTVKDADGVSQYAEFGLKLHITDAEAEFVRKLCLAFRFASDAGTLEAHTFYHDFESKFLES